MMPSILISTLKSRREQFAHIFDGLRAQARARVIWMPSVPRQHKLDSF